MKRSIGWALGVCLVGGSAYLGLASSHREAPLISADPLADNTDSTRSSARTRRTR